MLYVIIGNEKYRVDTADGYQLAAKVANNCNWPIYDDTDGEPTGDTFDGELEPKALALASALGVSPLSNIGYDGSGCGEVWTSDDAPGEYRVLDDAEREQAWDDALESYIDECILPDAWEPFARYFDREAWKSDARYDGCGHCLATYDGNEHEAMIDGEWFFIYRVN